MGVVCIEEYSDLAKDENGGDIVQCPSVSVAVQSITSSGTTARNGSDFDADTSFVIVTSDTAVHFAFGSDTVTASSSDSFLPANLPRAFGVDSSTPRLAVIDK